MLLTLGAAAAMVVIFGRLMMVRPCQRMLQLPFIVDIVHGVCPRCGEQQPISQAQRYWRCFRCKCGYSADMHIEDKR